MSKLSPGIAKRRVYARVNWFENWGGTLGPAGSQTSREVKGLIELEKHGIEPQVGDEIEVAEGALKGLRGIFQRELGDKERVMILLSYVTYQGQLLIEKKKLKKAGP